MSKFVPPLKWHGGKHYLAPKIVALMPPHVHYVEPYAGGLSVLLARLQTGGSEVVNDLNYELTNFWRTLANQDSFALLRRRLEATPFSEVEWETADHRGDDDHDQIYQAYLFFVACRQSLAGRMQSWAPLTKARLRRKINEQASAWWNVIDGLPEVHARLASVVVRCKPALEVIKSEDSKDTLCYLDPPYLHATRATTADYLHEMSAEDHTALLELLSRLDGKWMLSGYRSKLYDDWAEANGYYLTEFDVPNNAAGGKGKRRMTECLWTNFYPQRNKE